jgi:hypothetical protein
MEIAELGEAEYRVEFGLNRDNGTHEALVALNAIAAQNRHSFDAKDEHEKINEVLAEFLDCEMDIFTSTLQRLTREKSSSTGGQLVGDIAMRAYRSNLDYLSQALSRYRDNTPEAVYAEMRGNMGNQSALNRAVEAVTADNMLHLIKSMVGIGVEEIKTKAPMGFGRVLGNLELES